MTYWSGKLLFRLLQYDCHQQHYSAVGPACSTTNWPVKMYLLVPQCQICCRDNQPLPSWILCLLHRQEFTSDTVNPVESPWIGNAWLERWVLRLGVSCANSGPFTCCSSGRHGFGAQYIHVSSQLFITPVLGDPAPSSDLYRHQTQMWYVDAYRQNIHI